MNNSINNVNTSFQANIVTRIQDRNGIMDKVSKRFAEKTKIPFLNLLQKDFKTSEQHTLNESARKGNLLGAFSLNPKMKESIRDTRILLCDDIKTTGSTLDECAKTLLIGGAAEGRCITLCVTKNNK